MGVSKPLKMCLITEQRNPLVATEDKVVYKAVKVFMDYISSVYHEFRWTLGKIESTEFEIKAGGFGGYADSVSMDAYEEIYDDYLISISRGLHTASSKQRAVEVVPFESENCSLAECTIPKGAEYYEDLTGLLVSNQLRLDRIINI